VKLYLVRHAKAGDRIAWTGDDELRPLSPAGRRQAERLAERLDAAGTSRLISSPHVRCTETLEPLAARTGATIEVDERLREGRRFEGVLDLLAELPAHAVLCSHGDVIPDTIDALVRRGLDVRSAPEWRKASVWVLNRTNQGRFSRATVWPPPGK